MLQKNLLATIAYYDALDYPLTAFEAWMHLIRMGDDAEGDARKIRLGDVVAALSGDGCSGRVVLRDGFYPLRGREDLIFRRIRSEKISSAKLKRVRSLARLLAFVPFVRMIGVTGSLAMKNGDRESDWDLFVVLRAGRIFTGRTLLTGFLHAIGKRRHGKYHRDRACLNYYVSEDALRISTKDLFSAHEYRFLVPIVGEEVFRRFELKNRWIHTFKPTFRPTELLPLWYRAEPGAARAVRKSLEAFFDWAFLESWLASWQKRKIERNPKTRIFGGHIEATDQALIFLPEPRGPRVFERFMRTWTALRIR
jgi:predicted nucleotidyltransferase